MSQHNAPRMRRSVQAIVAQKTMLSPRTVVVSLSSCFPIGLCDCKNFLRSRVVAMIAHCYVMLSLAATQMPAATVKDDAIANVAESHGVRTTK